MKNSLGEDIVYWFGIVEDRNDPMKIGRVKVRIYNYAVESLELMPTKELFWAHFISTPNFTSPVPPRPGQMAFGIFADGSNSQYPLIMGILADIPEKETDKKKGFSDQRTDEQLKTEPRPPQSKTYSLTGQGVTIQERDKASRFPNKEYLDIVDEPTSPRLARNENIEKTFIQERKKHRLNSIPIVNRESSAMKWEEEITKYDAKYPHNQVQEFESGHIVEIDNTYEKERIHIVHRSGTFLEIEPKGNSIYKVVKDNYEITMGEDCTLSMGNSNVTIMKDGNIYIKGDLNMRVDGNVRWKILKDFKLEVGGNFTTNVSQDYFLNVGSDIDVKANGEMFVYVVEAIEQVSGMDTKVYVGSNFEMKSSGTMIHQSGGLMSRKASAVQEDAGSIHHNSGGAQSAGSADPAQESPAEILPGTPVQLTENG